MDLSELVKIVNSGIPAGIVARLTSEAIIRLIDKIKVKFNGKAVTEEKLKQLMNENADLRETLEDLEKELIKENIIINGVGKVEINHNTQQLQVSNMTINIFPSEVQHMMLDIFEANFYKLSQSSAQKAARRAEEMTNEFLQKLYSQIPNKENKLQEPAVQYSLFNALKEYAKTGNTELKEQLLDLLLQRINSDERSLKQIVLDKAIDTLPHITLQHVKSLTFIFMIENLAQKVVQNKDTTENSLNLNKFVNNLHVFSDIPHRNVRKTINTHLVGFGCVHETNYYTDGLYPTRNIENIVSKYYGREIDNYNEMRPMIESLDTNLAKWYGAWKMAATPLTKLTTIGIVIAVTNYNRQTNSNINLDDFL
jgi:hypothetical protein